MSAGAAPSLTIADQLSHLVTRMQVVQITMDEAEQAFRREWLLRALENSRGNKCAAARALGIHRNTVDNLVLLLGIDVHQIRSEARGRR